jgi:hypothetical protein
MYKRESLLFLVWLQVNSAIINTLFAGFTLFSNIGFHDFKD